MELTRDGEPRQRLQAAQRWSLSREALRCLLGRLGEQTDSAAREYESLRRSLAVFFALRGFVNADSLADETLDRVARRIEKGETVGHVRAYAYGVGRKVALESAREHGRERAAIETQRAIEAGAEASATREARVACLERCLQRLPVRSRSLIVDYYTGRGDSYLDERRLLARRLGISYTSLKTRAHRIRNVLEPCLRECLETKGCDE